MNKKPFVLITFLMIVNMMLSACVREETPETIDGFGGSGVVSGELMRWHTVTVDFNGPTASEYDNSPNPFLDYRLQVAFTGPSGQVYNVPGYFDGNGDGGGTGNIWRVRFTPDEAGQWNYMASFRRGTNIAIDLNANAGSPTSLDGANGSFKVTNGDQSATGFQKWGRLEYVGGFYLKFRDGPYWIKGGTNTPENFLGYADFDNTSAGHLGNFHSYSPHVNDWNPGDPIWGSGRGKGIIGMLNYLSSQKVNSLYFLPMNIGGDGKDTWPYAGSINRNGSSWNDNKHFDLSKLYQWSIVIDHAQQKGIVIHFVLGEREDPNEGELDNRALGTERKLFYRELVARFGHHNAILWNLGEEHNQEHDGGKIFCKDEIDAFADYIKTVSPYDSTLITAHGSPHNDEPANPARGTPAQCGGTYWGDDKIDLTSIQNNVGWRRNDLADHSYPWYGNLTEIYRYSASNVGRKIPIMFDEIHGVKKADDESTSTFYPYSSGHKWMRKNVLYPILFSGGHVEWILEYFSKNEDFRPFEGMWRYTWHARKFMEENLPFWEMEPMDQLLSGEASGYEEDGQVFAKVGEVYAIYLPKADASGQIDLSGASGEFEKRWYNPRTGQFEGSRRLVTAGSGVNLGAPPSSPREDWVVLVIKR